MDTLVAALLLQVATLMAPAATQPVEPPAESVLSRFVGSWKTEATIRNYGPPLREIHTTGSAVSRRTLEGRYVEFRTSGVNPPNTSELQLMMYDKDSHDYHQWVFDSDGYRHEARGHWNASTSTLRWEGQAGGAKIVIDDHWVSPDRLEWSLTRTAADGRLIQRIDGVVTRER